MTEPLTPFSPILPVPVPVDALSAAQSTRDWGDVQADVLELVAAYSALVDAVAGEPGGRMVCTVVEAVRRVERAEIVLGITWSEDGPGVTGPRRWRYRVC